MFVYLLFAKWVIVKKIKKNVITNSSEAPLNLWFEIEVNKRRPKETRTVNAFLKQPPNNYPPESNSPGHRLFIVKDLTG